VLWHGEVTEYDKKNESDPDHWSVSDKQEIDSEEPDAVAADAVHTIFFTADDGPLRRAWALTPHELQPSSTAALRHGGYTIYSKLISGASFARLQLGEKSPSLSTSRDATFIAEVPPVWQTAFYLFVNGEITNRFGDESAARGAFKELFAAPNEDLKTAQLVSAETPTQAEYDRPQVAYDKSTGSRVIEQWPLGELPLVHTKKPERKEITKSKSVSRPQRVQSEVAHTLEALTPGSIVSVSTGAFTQRRQYTKHESGQWVPDDDTFMRSSSDLSTPRLDVRIEYDAAHPEPEPLVFEQQELEFPPE
jgi:hypothetical protein